MSEKKSEAKLRYFEDVDCKKPITVIEFKDPVLRGEEEGKLTIYAKNATKDELTNIHFESKDKDLHIEPSADKISPEGVISLMLTFTPPKTRETELNTEFVVTGQAIVRGFKKP